MNNNGSNICLPKFENAWCFEIEGYIQGQETFSKLMLKTRTQS